MLENLLEFASQYGIIAVMFAWLLYTTNVHNADREHKYQQTIERNQEIIADAQKICIQLSQELKTFTHMSSDIKEIKGMVISIKDRDN